MPSSRSQERDVLFPPATQPATWFEFVADTEHVAFRQPLSTVFSRSFAVGELIGGPDEGTLVLIPIRPGPR